MKWRIQFLILVTVMSGLVLGGIHLAEEGIQRVDGMRSSSEAFHIARAESGKLEMTVLGRHYQLQDQGIITVPERKNWMSITGNTLGGWITTTVKGMIIWVEGR
ncbi:MAG TPA: DUF3679 domain-containing protein [Bacillota bacterium]|nr:DUF3679 domain-containing protein [Bacillota bacterium]